jgi:hypothetical protein
MKKIFIAMPAVFASSGGQADAIFIWPSAFPPNEWFSAAAEGDPGSASPIPQPLERVQISRETHEEQRAWACCPPTLGLAPSPLTENVRTRRRIRGHHRKLPIRRLFSCHRSRSEQKPSAFR